MVVAARAGHGEAEHAARYGVDALVALVGATLYRLGLIPYPRGSAEEACRLEIVGGGFLVEQVAGELHLQEMVVGHVVVEGFDDPVAIDVGAIERHVAAATRIEAANVVVGVARDIEPVPAPAFAIAWRGQQAIDNLGEGVGRLVFFKVVDLFRGRRHAGQIEGGATDQSAAVGHGRGLEALLFELR